MTTSPGRINLPAVAIVSAWTGVLVVVSFWMSRQAYHWLPVQASTAAPLVDGLFSFETALATFVVCWVVSIISWVVLFNRADKYDMSDAEPIEGNTRLEIIWTVIPALIVFGIAFYAVRVNQQLAVLGPMEHIHRGSPVEEVGGYAGDRLPPETVEVIARQWSWEFRYPKAHVSSTELHLPVDKPVTFRLVSEDVIHGFYVPAFRLKQDIIPGRAIDFNLTPTREGRYRLRDSMYSGTWFATNQADVVVESSDGFQHWLEQAASQPLQPGLSDAVQEYDQRQQAGAKGWATVRPASRPQVNFPGSNTLPHEA